MPRQRDPTPIPTRLGRASKAIPAAERALLINPPAYDIRLPWAQWLQPGLLLRLATHLKAQGQLVRLIDCTEVHGRERPVRTMIDRLDIDGIDVRRWRYGLPRDEFGQRLHDLTESGFAPDVVYVECLVNYWWEAAREVIRVVRTRIPEARIVLLGGYPTVSPGHALLCSDADEILQADELGLSGLVPDLALYDRPPSLAYIAISDGNREADEIVAEIASEVAGRRTFRFAFAEHGIATHHAKTFVAVLELLARRMLPAKLYVLGGIAPAEIVATPELPKLMKAAGFVQVNLADDRDCEVGQFMEDCRDAAALLDRAGFARGTDALAAGVCLGRTGEDVDERVTALTQLAHSVGSVLIWPYQPMPDECPGIALHLQNSKLFPLRHESGYRYSQYLDVLALGAVLNAKYREHGFDFLGDGRIPRLVRASLRERTWDPAPDEKGTIRLPVLARP